jgi:hypothetical protein
MSSALSAAAILSDGDPGFGGDHVDEGAVVLHRQMQGEKTGAKKDTVR